MIKTSARNKKLAVVNEAIHVFCASGGGVFLPPPAVITCDPAIMVLIEFGLS